MSPKTKSSLYWVAVVFVLLLFLAACLQGVANYWVWGHDGFNGSAFAQAAKNSLRFDTFAMHRRHMGLEPFALTDSYTHHPMSIHAHIIAAYKLLGGYSAWAARLPTAVYSWLIQVMLFVFVKRYYGKWTALLAAIAYALIPLNLIYANMISHQQGSLFWCLFFIFFYSRWREEGRNRFLVLVVFGVSMAIQYDWAAYYVAFFTVVHAFVAGIRRGGKVWHWRSEYTFCAIFSVVVLANVFVFFAYIAELRGGFHEMASAYAQRTASPPDYIPRLWKQSVDLYGIFYLALIPVWAVQYGVRVRRGTTHLGDQIPAYFLLAQIIHSYIFKDAGYLHAYWTYNLNPGLAVMVATVLISGVQWTLRGVTRWRTERGSGISVEGQTPSGDSGRAISALVVALVIVLPITLQTRFACKQWAWGFDTGDASYVEPYEDQYMDLVFAEHLAKRFNRSNADFLIHWGLAWRIEPLAYLDAPHEWVGRLQFRTNELRSERHQILLLDLEQVNDIDQVGKLVREHPSWIYDEKFVAIDGSVEGGGITAYYSDAQEPSLWWNWLVNFRRPPITWTERPVEPKLHGMFADGFEAATTETAGGFGGQTIKWHCPYGYVLAGFDVWTSNGHPTVVRGLRPECRSARSVVEKVPRVDDAVYRAAGIGDRFGAPDAELRCGDGSVVTKIHGHSGQFVDAIGIDCGEMTKVDDEEEAAVASLGDSARVPAVGGSGGNSFHLKCPDRAVGFGFEAAAGAYVDRVALTCVFVDSPFLSGRADSPAEIP